MLKSRVCEDGRQAPSMLAQRSYHQLVGSGLEPRLMAFPPYRSTEHTIQEAFRVKHEKLYLNHESEKCLVMNISLLFED